MTPLVLTTEPASTPTEVSVADPVTTVEMHHRGVRIPDLPGIFDAGYGVLAGCGPVGPGYAIYDGDPSEVFDLAIGFPVAQVPAQLPEGVVAAGFPGGRMLVVSHIGSFDGLPDAWTALAEHPAADGAGRFIEIYVADPSVTPEDELRTDLVIPLD